MDEEMVKTAGELCGRRDTDDTINATVALTGRRHRSVVLTSDPTDLRRLDTGVEVVAV
jgi:hypothetical protein